MNCPSPEELASNTMSFEERGAWLDHAASCPSCHAVALVMSSGGAPPGAPPAEQPQRIGRFVITREIGRGAMGLVYAAEDPELGRPIAIKVLHETTATERLRREARALARLAHDNVVRIYDVGTEGERVFVAMELVTGQNLRQWLATEPRAFEDVLRVVVLAGRGLAAAHAAGIVHRDFKPDNVLLSQDRVVVGDFGLSQIAGGETEARDLHRSGDAADAVSSDRLTMTGAAVGTPAYMAPEQVAGTATAASDQFAYCVAVWEACYGVRPFAGATLRELREHVRAGYFTRPVGRAVPRRIERALRRGLSAEPSDRFGSMDELLAQLAPRRRKRWIALAAVIGVMLPGVVAWRMAGRDEPDPCARTADAILEHWTPAVRTRVRETRGAPSVAELDRYVAAWRTARAESCRAATSSSVAEVERRAAREACYERARVELAKHVAVAGTLAELRAGLVPLDACTTQLPLAQTPGTASDARGCGCPYSACGEDHVCVSECNARAFRRLGPVLGISNPHQQDAILGASLDGATLLYLSGEDCSLDHLYLARRRGDEFESIDLTAQLAPHGVIPREGCCTLAPDGRSIVVARADRLGFLRFPLAGDRLGDGDPRELANLLPDARPTDRLFAPVLSADQRTVYFGNSSSQPERSGSYEAQRASVEQPFGPGRRLTGRASLYEYVTGVSSDSRSLFMAAEFTTRVLVRATTTEPFGDLGITLPPAHLPGWRAIPIDHCRRIITTMTPGGCASEDIVYLEAIGP